MCSCKAAKLFLDGDEKFGIADSRLDLEPVSDNALVLHEPFNILLSHLGDFIDIKVIKCFSIPFSFTQYGDPAQASLGTFQSKELKEKPVVRNEPPPFFIVVFDIKAVSAAPTASSIEQVLHFHSYLASFFMYLYGYGEQNVLWPHQLTQ